MLNFKFLAICLFAVAIAKWGQRVQADGVNDLNDDEKRLLQKLEDALDEGKREIDDCDVDCGNDEECYDECNCYELCLSDGDDEDVCENYCRSGNEKRMVAGQDNQDQSNMNNMMAKKALFGRIRIPTPRIPIPRIPIPRIPTPRIPRIRWPRIPTPRIPRPRIPTPRIPRIRWPWGKK